jgi:hypothetical protein
MKFREFATRVAYATAAVGAIALAGVAVMALPMTVPLGLAAGVATRDKDVSAIGFQLIAGAAQLAWECGGSALGRYQADYTTVNDFAATDKQADTKQAKPAATNIFSANDKDEQKAMQDKVKALVDHLKDQIDADPNISRVYKIGAKADLDRSAAKIFGDIDKHQLKDLDLQGRLQILQAQTEKEIAEKNGTFTRAQAAATKAEYDKKWAGAEPAILFRTPEQIKKDTEQWEKNWDEAKRAREQAGATAQQTTGGTFNVNVTQTGPASAVINMKTPEGSQPMQVQPAPDKNGKEPNIMSLISEAYKQATSREIDPPKNCNTQTFSKSEDFKQSPVYRSMDPEDKKQYTSDFPKKVITVSFDTLEEAQAFIAGLKDKGVKCTMLKTDEPGLESKQAVTGGKTPEPDADHRSEARPK